MDTSKKRLRQSSRLEQEKPSSQRLKIDMDKLDDCKGKDEKILDFIQSTEVRMLSAVAEHNVDVFDSKFQKHNTTRIHLEENPDVSRDLERARGKMLLWAIKGHT